MYKNILYIFLNILFTSSSYSSHYQNYYKNNNLSTETSTIKIDLLFGAGYMMWVCTNFGKTCSSAFTINNGTLIEAKKGDIFYIGIAALPRICDFYRVIESNSFAVISYWGTVFNPYFNIYGDDIIQYLRRESTYNIISGCAKLQGKHDEQ